MKDKYTFVDGIKIRLTEYQIEYIKNEKERLDNELSSFEAVLDKLGFKKHIEKCSDKKNTFTYWDHPDSEAWFVDIERKATYFELSIKGLSSCSDPWGKDYECPKKFYQDMLNEMDYLSIIK